MTTARNTDRKDIQVPFPDRKFSLSLQSLTVNLKFFGRKMAELQTVRISIRLADVVQVPGKRNESDSDDDEYKGKSYRYSKEDPLEAIHLR